LFLQNDPSLLLNLLATALKETHRTDEELDAMTEHEVQTVLRVILNTSKATTKAEFKVTGRVVNLDKKPSGKPFVDSNKYVDIVIIRSNTIWVIELKNKQARYLDRTSVPELPANGTRVHVAEAVSKLSMEELEDVKVVRNDKFHGGWPLKDILTNKADPQLQEYVAALKKDHPKSTIVPISVLCVAASNFVWRVLQAV